MGANPATVFRLLAGERVPPAMLGRMLAFAGAALARWPLSLAERAYVAMRRDPLASMPPPVFILGHWRSGTTHLYNLLSRDPRFAWPDPIATGIPWDFLLLGRALRPLLERALPESRFIDNVAVNPDSPQEDEIALASMQTLSYYHALYFPEQFARHFEQGLFPEAAGVIEKRLRKRERALRHYARKLLLAGRGNTLLVKNPAWTGQVAWLRKIWPEARFIHIHRNPYAVFESTRKFYRRLLPPYSLQAYDPEAVEPFILETYPRMLKHMYADTADLPASQFIEIGYNELEDQPLDCLARIYRQLEIGDFETVRPAIERYL
ncbi:MAG: sulfotransferase family protein, partial [Wenzhouxiangellaceae bacterium]